MVTYTIQQMHPSGDTFAIRYNDDNTIGAVAGPLHHTDVSDAAENPSVLADYEYNDETEHDNWGYPIVSYDPKI